MTVVVVPRMGDPENPDPADCWWEVVVRDGDGRRVVGAFETRVEAERVARFVEVVEIINRGGDVVSLGFQAGLGPARLGSARHGTARQG